jgi:threonine aldolase
MTTPVSDRTGSGRQFASDNNAGICPEAWESMQAANRGHAAAYGNDSWTQNAARLIRDFFETRCEVFFVFNGTAANSLALASLCQSYHSVITTDTAHVETDECGGPEFFSNGTKILTVPQQDGKLPLSAVEHAVRKRTDIHYPKPKVVSCTQATELGTVYTVEELKALGATARRFGLKLHMDGARFANAVASLGVSPAEMTWKAGVDVLCLGGTKNGLPVGEAVVFFDPALANEFDYRCKQAGQLASKMRFLSAPWAGLLESGAFLRNAQRANAAARRLEAGLMRIPGIELMFPSQANSVFVRLRPEVATGLRERGWKFYEFIGAGGARFMCSWDTSNDDVDALIAAVAAASSSSVPTQPASAAAP